MSQLILWFLFFAAVAWAEAKTRILVLCTGNSARSQMTEGFLRSLDPDLAVFSAGTNPGARVNPLAIQAMKEIGIELTGHHPKHVREFLGQKFDFVVTVCDDADKNCPNFIGKVGKRLRIGFPDPAKAVGSEAEKLAMFQKTRDDIRARFREFHATYVQGGRKR